MRNETKQKFNAYVARIAELNGVTVDDVKEKFTVTPSVEQKLVEKVLLSSQFLQWINVVRDPLMEAELVGLEVAAAIASTTDTNRKDRETKDISSMSGRRYKCEQVNFDTHIADRSFHIGANYPISGLASDTLARTSHQRKSAQNPVAKGLSKPK
ncbi:P2 family phage major capsid protein [Avibacterium paragallinarum]|uniref:Phage major capsid protein, P2 family n=1 Tax=Avibacterium paragallinarum TaxID=728 RepID=A0ABU7QLT8_AVIPA|nr:P2 family phage major capsid protein [Avibacterium paragallinarum]